MIHVYLELGKPLCDATGCLEILCAPCCSQMEERHRCYCQVTARQENGPAGCEISSLVEHVAGLSPWFL